MMCCTLIRNIRRQSITPGVLQSLRRNALLGGMHLSCKNYKNSMRSFCAKVYAGNHFPTTRPIKTLRIALPTELSHPKRFSGFSLDVQNQSSPDTQQSALASKLASLAPPTSPTHDAYGCGPGRERDAVARHLPYGRPLDHHPRQTGRPPRRATHNKYSSSRCANNLPQNSDRSQQQQRQQSRS